ncbi:hypothetical protein [Kocuria sp. SL71]|uniref:hypothetical protein n=1 Tax=Kocuria sp. SL71 TaxID=2995151 RepID=UPI002274DC57|nr:hypothetical protein [Kocuria sp. SL71]MCY1684540.1 hypothetical protein [Kocuria sp. SL71]
MNEIKIDQAARLATGCLRAANGINANQVTPVVSRGCIDDLIAMNFLTPSATSGLLDATEIERIFSRTRVLDGKDLSVLRVSIGPLKLSGPTDPVSLPTGVHPRRFSGWDFANTKNLTPDEAQAGIAGVWPLSEESARKAEAVNAIFAPAVKGFVAGDLVCQVIGYSIDLTTRRRWFKLDALTQLQHRYVFGSDGWWQHLWITVPRGAVAGIEFSPQDLAMKWNNEQTPVQH